MNLYFFGLSGSIYVLFMLSSYSTFFRNFTGDFKKTFLPLSGGTGSINFDLKIFTARKFFMTSFVFGLTRAAQVFCLF